MREKLLFLLTNDDGIFSEGLIALWKYLKKMGDVCVVVPETERSATAHSINLSTPLRIKEVSLKKGLSAYITDGTPVDCVKIGVKTILKRNPDFVISGINLGPNLGMDIFYSGTVAAACEGAILGIPSISVSIAGYKNFKFDDAAKVTIEILKKVIKINFPPDTVLNVNIPNKRKKEIKGIRITSVSYTHLTLPTN